MKLGHCPICRTELTAESLTLDKVTTELMALMARVEPRLGSVLLSYIGLFRPAKSKLTNSRALKLINEVLTEFTHQKALIHCMEITVNNILDQRRNHINTKPMTNHNYLKKVYNEQKPQFTSYKDSKEVLANAGKGTPVNSAQLAKEFEERFGFKQPGVNDG